MVKSVVVHDYMQHADGGSRLCVSLGKNLEADLCYGFRLAAHPYFSTPYPQYEFALSKNYRIPLFKQYMLAKDFGVYRPEIDKYSHAVLSGFYAPLMAKNLSAKTLFYCHTPPRFIYDQVGFYDRQVPSALYPVWALFKRWYKNRFEEAVNCLPLIVANSKAVKERVGKYLYRNAEIVHPPCRIEDYRWSEDEGYYLSTARLDPLKRVGRIVEAFTKMPDKKLIVMSSGSESDTLKKKAQGFENIQFTGAVSEQRYRDLLAKSLATIYIPVEEDFGMSPVESMAAGKPVIGVAEGGMLESTVDGQNGILLPPDFQEEELCTAVGRVDRKFANQRRESCMEQAEIFSEERFVTKIRELLF
ncbi:MAG: glycosyltransferase [Desulfovibrio sp.]